MIDALATTVFSARLLLAILCDERSGIGRAAGRGHPPVLAGADASLIAALVEKTFLSIIVGHTTRAQARQAQEQLQRAHAKLAGIIMLNA